MTNSMAFHTQIASIMEVLANAAVAEICKLVDDDYAVIRLDVTQCQRENRALKRKLQTLELKMARERAERTMRERVFANRPGVSVKIHDKFRAAAGRARGHLPGHHRSFGKPESVAMTDEGWRMEEQALSTNKGPDSSTQDIVTVTIFEESAGSEAAGSQSHVKQERCNLSPPPPPARRPDSDQHTHSLVDSEDVRMEECLIKREREEEEEEEEEQDTIGRDEDNTDFRKSDEARSPRTWTSGHQDPVLYFHESGPRPGPGPGPGQGPEQDQAEQCFRPLEHGHWTGGPALNNPGPEPVMSSTWSHRRPGAGPGAGAISGPAGARSGAGPGPGYGAGAISGPAGARSGAGPGPGYGAGAISGPAGARSGAGPRSWPGGAGARPGAAVARPAVAGPGAGAEGSGAQAGAGTRFGLHIGPEPQPQLNLTHPPPPHSYLPTTHSLRLGPQNQCGPAFNPLLHHSSLYTTASSANQNSGAVAPLGGVSVPLHPGRAEGRGKSDRERPYSCPTCGKRFAEAGYVKKHQTVHTKEKPFRCKQCWKSFSFLSNLIRHRGVHSSQGQGDELTGVLGGVNVPV